MGGNPGFKLSNVLVTGSRSGTHAGHLLPYSQGDGASFLPARPFDPGELVTVHAALSEGGKIVTFAWSFTAAVQDHGGHAGGSPRHAPQQAAYQSFRSRPELKPPTVTVTAHDDGASKGDVFIAPYSGPGQYGPMILDGAGNTLYLRAVHPYERSEMTAVFASYRDATQLVPPAVFAALLTAFELPAVFVAGGVMMLGMAGLARYIPRRF